MMDIDKFIEFAQSHFTGYVKTFSAVASGPIYGKENPINTLDLTPELWRFVILSIAIGATLAGITGLKSDTSLLIVIIFLFVNWCAFSLWAFVFCRFLLRGTATFQGTLTTLLYLLAAIFVSSHFVALLANIISKPIAEFSEIFEPKFIASGMYLLAQAVLLAIYLPVNLRSANNFGLIRTIFLVIFVPLPMLSINATIILALGLDLSGGFGITK